MELNYDKTIGQRTVTVNVFYEPGIDVKEGDIVMIDPEGQSTPEKWESHQYPAPVGPCTTEWKLGYLPIGISPTNVVGSKAANQHTKLHPCVVSGSFPVMNYSGRTIEPGDRLIVGPSTIKVDGDKRLATFHPVHPLTFKLSLNDAHLTVLRLTCDDKSFADQFCPSFTRLPLYAVAPNVSLKRVGDKSFLDQEHNQLFIHDQATTIKSKYHSMRSCMVCAKAISKSGTGQPVTVILRH